MTLKRTVCGAVALLLALLLLPGTIEAQRGRGAQLVKIRVRSGETVGSLAERYNVKAEEIARLNGVEQDAQLQPGTEILMPSTTSPATEQARRAPTAQMVASDVRARAARYEPFIRAAAERYGIDPRALWTIAFLETRFRPDQISPKGARGMMQFMPGTAATYGLTNSFDPIASIDAAARYVRYLAARFDNRTDLILAGYNSGEGTVEAYLRGVPVRQANGKVINPRGLRTNGVPPYEETRNYVARGLSITQYIGATGVFRGANMVAYRVSPSSPNVMKSNASESLVVTNTPAIAVDETRTITDPPASVYAVRDRANAVVIQPAAGMTIASPAVVSPSASPDSLTVPTQPQSTYVFARGGKR